jgi:DNA-binding transcriptional LysR family regulator
MAITKETAIDQITVTENGIVLYREATRIMEDGKELSKTYSRSSLTPGQNLTGQPANVVAHCNLAWTPEVIAAYQAQVAAQAQQLNPQAGNPSVVQPIIPAA